eukprot:CAMPEP_0182860530 /NCGR_PEP_ID=MMETSP0034_2-20130328/4972_1 /TAXON_ID=156128 /ORGANISM="Nephroselmis pyriformis, Strain CCMP717" /LENGTH=75 /DNA_ID=CAMNT_0024992335 /DNA_START=190 /DNA_END=413 /DNA_ORIENTATION=-
MAEMRSQSGFGLERLGASSPTSQVLQQCPLPVDLRVKGFEIWGFFPYEPSAPAMPTPVDLRIKGFEIGGFFPYEP